MAAEAPDFWWKKKGFMWLLLAPVSAIYGYFARQNMEKKHVPAVDRPVLCIGNYTLGGTGKTPVAIAFAKAANAQGLKPGIVSRGYGSTNRGVHLVDPDHDRARDVGDEPLLLARHALVVISTDRHQAASRLLKEGCDLIIMDDGFQSRRLWMDYALLVVDALRGLGNGAVFPAGPLRAPLSAQLAYTDGVLVIGEGEGGDHVIRMAARAAKPLHLARLQPSANLDIKGKRVLAFAGIGNPEKFFRSVQEMGAVIVQTRSYDDHHFFTDYDIQDIVQSAEAHDLWLATTAKDYQRLKTDGQTGKLEKLAVVDVDVFFEDQGFCDTILKQTINNFKQSKYTIKS